VLDSVRLAVGTLTAAPTGAVRVTPRIARRAMLIAPLAVAPLAAVTVLIGWGVRALGWSGLVSGLLVVVVLAAGTRALHLDGLADTVDGLGGGASAGKALEIMRRGDIGPMGVVALVVTLGTQAALIAGVPPSSRSWLLVALAVCGSRAALGVGCARGVPAARPDGLGAAVAGTVPRWAAALGWVLVAVALTLASRPAWLGLASAVVGLLAALGVTATAVRRLGGITGDVLGAAVELTFTAMLLMALR
jgi:adenosylcobinamide-GDP ribazoletransferase